MPREDWIKNAPDRVLSAAGLWPWKPGELQTVLDVGCGLSLKSQHLDIPVRVGVDIYEPYLRKIDAQVPYAVVKCDVRHLRNVFLDASFDLVLALDIVEHIEKAESEALIADLERIARRGVIITTPKGYSPQDIDIWGHGGDEWQTHRCGWEPEELQARGYKTHVRDYQMSSAPRHTAGPVKLDIQMIDAIKTLEK